MDETEHRSQELETLVPDGEDNRVTAVTVFSDRALVTRRVAQGAHAGLNRILIEVQAFDLDRDSVQARVYGEGEILSVQSVREPTRQSPQKALHGLEDKLRGLVRRQRALQAERKATRKQLQLLDSLLGFAKVELPAGVKTAFPSTEQMGGLLEFLRARYLELGEAQNRSDEALEDLEDELKLVDRRIKQLRGAEAAEQPLIEVLFDAAGEQPLTIEASYVTRRASWEPVYRVDVPADLSEVILTLFGRVHQKTGEDWREVALTLSNALPLGGGALPEAGVWRLEAPPAPMAAVAAEGQPATPASAVREDTVLYDLVEEPEAGYQQAEASELPVAFEYTLPRAIDIGSGARETLTPVFTRRPPAEVFHYAVPREVPHCYLVGRLAGDPTLLPGRLNIHFAGRYLGSTYLDEKRPGEELLLNLGAERGVQVRREQVGDTRSETFLGVVDRQSIARELRYRIAVENLKSEPVRLRLIDSLPVAQSDRIQVKGLEMDPPPSERDWMHRQGVMMWDLELAPQSTREVRIHFFVRYPKDAPPWNL